MHFGLGPIGAAIVKQVGERPGFKIVGAIDVDPGEGRPRSRRRRRSAAAARRQRVDDDRRQGAEGGEARRRRALHELVDQEGACRSSRRSSKSKTAIVSTTEELSYPGYTHIRQARQIHALGEEGQGGGARHRRQSGIRDGRAADHADRGLRARRSRRRSTACRTRASRRLPFQQKIGAGLTTEQFQKKVDDGSVRHVGLTESIAMIADALGWTLDRITDDVQPKLATVTISSEFLAVDPGYVCGIVQDGVGYRKGRAGHPPAHGGVPGRAGNLRRRRHRRVAAAVDEDCRAAFTATSRPRRSS